MPRTLTVILWLAASILAAPVAVAVMPPSGDARVALPDLDARGDRLGVVAAKTPAQAEALARLRAELANEPGGELVFVPGPDPGTLHHLFRRGGYLSGPASGTSETIARAFVGRHRDLVGLSADGVRALQSVHDIVDPGTGARHVGFEQRVGGLSVFHGEVRVHLDASGRVLSVGGNSAREEMASAVRSVTPAEAVGIASAACGVAAPAGGFRETGSGPGDAVMYEQGPLEGAPWVRPASFPTAAGLRSAWVVTVDPAGDPGWYQVVVDAATGAILHRVNLVAHAATEGLVFRQDPGMGPQVLLPFVDDATRTDPASPAGWSAAGLTTGNNCDVKDDIANDNEDTDGRRAQAAAGPPLSFAFPFQDDPALDLDASLTNLFYLNNWLHDRLARLGFDEASGNFQAVNASGRGRGGDAVFVDAQDGSGQNNANFGTPPDGFPPRMQMYIWTFTNPRRDSGFDASVVTHELVHGVSNRLVGLAANDAGCLGGPQGGAMGEAWSDFFACSFWDFPTVGGYLVNDTVRGIRRAPYDAYPYNYGQLCNQGGFQVHRDGEIWAATLWDIRALMIARHGFQRGRCLTERLVLDGMKLAPCLPTYVDMRDAILLAAQLRGADGDTCLLWQGFAARGLGTAAVSKSGCTTAADASFVAPDECAACVVTPPTDLVLDTSAPNAVIARFTPATGATEHVLLRAAAPCPGACAETSFVEVARGPSDATALVVADSADDPMTAGARFSFRVVAVQGACSASTDCVEATVTGRCTLPPVVAGGAELPGVTALERPPQQDCAIVVHFAGARSACGAPSAVRHNIYRSTDPAFTPGREHLIGSVRAPATSFVDSAAPASEVTYAVRAEDMTTGGVGPHGGNEEANMERLSLAPQGPVSGTTTFTDDGEAGERPGYRRTGSFPVNDWGLVADANTRGGSAWHVTNAEGGNADKNLHLPPLSLGTAPRLRFAHAFQCEDAFDGGVIEISVDGGRTWRDLLADFVAGGYSTSRGAGRTLTVEDLIHPPNTDELWTGENASGFPVHDAVEVDLLPYAGTLDAQLRFRLLLDPLAVEPGGWYVDDLVVEDTLTFAACATTCTQPPVATLRPVVACTSTTDPIRVRIDASASAPGASPLVADLGLVLTHDGPGSFPTGRWATGPEAVLEFPAGTPAGDYPVRLTARDEAGCVTTVTADVSLRDETVVPPALGSSLRVTKSGAGILLTWAEAGAPSHNAHVAAMPAGAAGLRTNPAWQALSGSPALIDTGLARLGAGSLFVIVNAASDCGRSVP